MIVLRSDERVKAAFKSLDTDKDGQISVTEFCNWCIRTYTNEGSEKVFQQLEYIEGLLPDNVETVLKPTKLKRQASATVRGCCLLSQLAHAEDAMDRPSYRCAPRTSKAAPPVPTHC